MDLSIVIVNWNSKAQLEACLASIMASADRPSCEVIVIDAGSYDGCDALLREHYPQVQFIQSRTNVGFARANNAAYRASTGRAVLFLNPDTEAVGDAIAALHAQLTSLHGAGVVGPRLLNSDGTLQTTCIRAFPTILNRVCDSEWLQRCFPRSRLWGMAPLFEPGVSAREVEAVSGACLMVTREAFDKVGLFSDDYFMYAEDMDLSYKLRASGYRNYYVPAATVIHHGGRSSGHTGTAFPAVMTREATMRFFTKTRGHAYALTYRCAMGLSAVGRLAALACARPLYGRRKAAWMASFGKWWAVLRWSVRRDGLVERYYPPNPTKTI